MHHWTDLEAGIAELVRVLTPGGRMLLVDEDFDDPAHPDFESFGAKRQEEHRHEFHTVDPDVVSAALSTAGVTASFAGRQAIVGRPALRPRFRARNCASAARNGMTCNARCKFYAKPSWAFRCNSIIFATNQ